MTVMPRNGEEVRLFLGSSSHTHMIRTSKLGNEHPAIDSLLVTSAKGKGEGGMSWHLTLLLQHRPKK